MVKKIILVLCFMILFSLGSFIYPASSQASSVCCEKTLSGTYCQNVPANECNNDYDTQPTNCDSTSFCETGICFDSTEGTCLDNVAKVSCEENGGAWLDEENPSQCNFGCCILGDQAALVTWSRCNALTASYGLEINWRGDITDQTSCIEIVSNQDKGACVYDLVFEKRCTFGTRAECDGSSQSAGGNFAEGDFEEGSLCTDPELGTVCGKSEETTCLPGKDGVYFVDTCGNRANIYDSSKQDNNAYWKNLVAESNSCGFGSGNIESPSCGNCDYLLGSYCRDKSISNVNPTYGNFICADLNCKDTSNGNDYTHGESWCVNDDYGGVYEGGNSVGSEFYRHECINGEEIVEPCEGLRQEVCGEAIVNNDFSSAICTPNRYDSCFGQDNKDSCEDTLERDCIWREGIPGSYNYDGAKQIWPGFPRIAGSCLPKNSPGRRFWEGDESQNYCSTGTSYCVVRFTSGLLDFGDYECEDNCECLYESWYNEQAGYCSLLGDCGTSKNWVGVEGNSIGYDIIRDRLD
jgi:hypothetical protein